VTRSRLNGLNGLKINYILTYVFLKINFHVFGEVTKFFIALVDKWDFI